MSVFIHKNLHLVRIKSFPFGIHINFFAILIYLHCQLNRFFLSNHLLVNQITFRIFFDLKFLGWNNFSLWVEKYFLPFLIVGYFYWFCNQFFLWFFLRFSLRAYFLIFLFFRFLFWFLGRKIVWFIGFLSYNGVPFWVNLFNRFPIIA